MNPPTPSEVAAWAMDAWEATPTEETTDWRGRRHVSRERPFRATFVEPLARRIDDWYRASQIDAEQNRQLHDACLSAIPRRRRHARTLWMAPPEVDEVIDDDEVTDDDWFDDDGNPIERGDVEPEII